MPPGVDKSYDAIDGKKLHGYVEELSAISERYRDAGNQWWGRIAGTPSMTESQNWFKQKLDAMGIETQTVAISDPQDLPKSWDGTVSAGGKTLKLDTLFPLIDFARFAPSTKGDDDLDTVWVSLGQESDFIGKDVRGKAVIIYSIPTPSALIQSAMWMESVGRAEKAGAAAVIVDVAIPGTNMKYVSHMNGGRLRDVKIPLFTIGDQDGEAVEHLNAMVKGVGLKTHLRWDVEHYDGKDQIVIGKLPGTTDENAILLAHMDGFFDGAIDDGAGTAAVVGVADYFSRVPKAKRRRTLYFISLPDHHGDDQSGLWLHQNFKAIFAKTALITNSEHVAVTDSVLDRRWGSNDEPSLIASNASYPSWWGVYGSGQLAHLIVRDLATFGMPTQLSASGAEGELTRVQFDAPSFYIDNKGAYFHCDADTADKVPADTLRNAVQAFAKIYQDIDKMELKDLQAPASERPGVAEQDQGQ